MLIAEDLLLLITDDVLGHPVTASLQTDCGLAGAVLVELVLLHRVGLSGKADAAKPGRVVVRDDSPTGDAVLDAALTTAGAHAGATPSALIRPLGKNLRAALYERLVGHGVLRGERRRTLGILPMRAWLPTDGRRKDELRGAITQALVQATTPDQRTAALIALLHAMRLEHRVVDTRETGLSAHQLRAQADAIAQGDWASEAVRKAISEALAAIVAATAAGAAATAAGS